MANIGYENRWIVTEENISETVDDMAACDQAKELTPGCETWGIIYTPGNQRGQMTVWPEEERAAVCHGGDSCWGDWDSDSKTLRTDDDPSILYDVHGDEVDSE